MLKQKMLIAALAVSAIGFVPYPAAAEVGVYLDFAPPEARFEAVPEPRAGYVWQQGYWDWRSGKHTWVKGYWVHERKGYYWHPNRWEEENGHWRLHKGTWSHERYASRDSDHDGVPNSVDRHPNDPNRR
jgi:hypothetical protein